MAKRVTITDNQIEKIKTQYVIHGIPMQKIALELGVSTPTISRYLKLAGVEVKGKGRRPSVKTKPVKVVETTALKESEPFLTNELNDSSVEQTTVPVESTPVFSF